MRGVAKDGARALARGGPGGRSRAQSRKCRPLAFDAMTVTLRGPGLTEAQVVAVARHAETVALAAAARQKMERSRVRVENAARSRDPVYGVSTGFGALALSADVKHAYAVLFTPEHARGSSCCCIVAARPVEALNARQILGKRIGIIGSAGASSDAASELCFFARGVASNIDRADDLMSGRRRTCTSQQ